MPFVYFMKINKLRPGGKLCVVKKTQNNSISVVETHRFPVLGCQVWQSKPSPFTSIVFSFGIGNAQLRGAVAGRSGGGPELARGVALVAIGAVRGLEDVYVFPLFERHALREEVR